MWMQCEKQIKIGITQIWWRNNFFPYRIAFPSLTTGNPFRWQSSSTSLWSLLEIFCLSVLVDIRKWFRRLSPQEPQEAMASVGGKTKAEACPRRRSDGGLRRSYSSRKMPSKLPRRVRILYLESNVTFIAIGLRPETFFHWSNSFFFSLPCRPPEFDVEDTVGLSNAALDDLKTVLAESAREFIGNVMIHDIALRVKVSYSVAPSPE
jgi:hypothetical protein